MINMLPTILQPILPFLWALIACVWWWRRLSAKWLFAVTALFALFGIQVVITWVWDAWPFTGKMIVLIPSEVELQRHLEAENHDAIVKAILLLIFAIPYLHWLKRRLSILSIS